MNRESDLIDVWFDSGSMPYAQWHYPFENKDLIDENNPFQQILLLKELIKHVVGFIPYTQLRPWFLIQLPTKMLFLTDWF